MPASRPRHPSQQMAYSPRHARAMPAPRPRHSPVTPGNVFLFKKGSMDQKFCWDQMSGEVGELTFLFHTHCTSYLAHTGIHPLESKFLGHVPKTPACSSPRRAGVTRGIFYCFENNTGAKRFGEAAEPGARPEVLLAKGDFPYWGRARIRNSRNSPGFSEQTEQYGIACNSKERHGTVRSHTEQPAKSRAHKSTQNCSWVCRSTGMHTYSTVERSDSAQHCKSPLLIGAGVTGQWRGHGAGVARAIGHVLAWVARAWRGHGAGVARACPGQRIPR
eukprot:gene5475-biopygen1164